MTEQLKIDVSGKHDYTKLRKAVLNKFGKQSRFAAAMGLSERSVSLKLNDIRCWTQNEMRKFCDIMMIPYTEIPDYFFVFDVQY